MTLGRKGLGGCSKRASPGVNPPQVVAPRQRVELVLRLRPLTDPPTYLPGVRLRAGVGLFDVQGPDGRTTQPAIATAELVVTGAGAARLALRPGVDADLKRPLLGGAGLASIPRRMGILGRCLTKTARRSGSSPSCCSSSAVLSPECSST